MWEGMVDGADGLSAHRGPLPARHPRPLGQAQGALEVMQEVGRAWQSISDTDKKYFKEKADNDKHRYLAESRKFYDEVARIGATTNTGGATSGKKSSG